MERIEDRSKALSYIGIEVADALKVIPKPIDMEDAVKPEKETRKEIEIKEYQQSILLEKKPSLWQKFKKSKIARAFSYIFKIRIKIELPNALPEGRGE